MRPIWLMALLLMCWACGSSAKGGLKEGNKVPTSSPSTLQAQLSLARGHFDRSRYDDAETALRSIIQSSGDSTARLLLAKVLLLTGRYGEAARTQGRTLPEPLWEQTALVVTEALLRQGRIDEARASIEPAAARPEAWGAKRQLAEVLLLQGERAQAETMLHQVINAYNTDAISEHDSQGLAQVGRAAQLLRSPHDANDAYNLAEQAAQVSHDQLLLWRADMLLERHDPDQAVQVLAELLGRAPLHPLALALMAQARLAQTLDLQAAEELANRALQINPGLSEAHFVLAGVRLRDLDLAQAEAQLNRGLAHNPRDLELLSLQGTSRFLAGDDAGFAAIEQRVFTYNRQYARFYTIVAEYADWEHRYQKVVELLQRGVQVDEQEPAAHAGIGLNLIRLGDDAAGRAALQRAFALDPFDVRVYNTLNLFERVIDKDYQSSESGQFRFRYNRNEQAILTRYVPSMMAEAWRRMVTAYGFTPSKPVGVELYADRQHFAVRTSGLPNTGISGVCFGQTLAVVTPAAEPLNLGMTLWHELAHVFHIQLSNSRVPRWFTEGLAEYETLVQRSEWSREHDLDLYRALREQRLPKVAQMNRAFSHAESMQDMAVAYYASSQLVTLLAERFGRQKLRLMLQLWGEGKDNEAVLQMGLGVSSEALDTMFREYLAQRLSRYSGQFVALSGSGSSARWRAQLRKAGADSLPHEQSSDGQAHNELQLQLRLAVSLIEEGDLVQAGAILDTLLKAEPKNAQAQFFRARSVQATDPGQCVQRLARLQARGEKGYDVHMLSAQCQTAAGVDPKAALWAAHQADRTQSQPLIALWRWAQQAGDEDQELSLLRELAKLEQHAGGVYRRLLQLLIKRGAIDEALKVGDSALWVDIENAETHLLYGDVLARAGRIREAEAELESALLCSADPRIHVRAHLRYAELLEGRGQLAKGRAQRAEADALRRAHMVPE